MNIYDLLEEYEINLNDVRWYLADRISFTLLEYKNDKDALVKFIESGELEESLYNMEEKYIEELQDLADRDKIDEVNVREAFNEIVMLKRKRR